MKVPAFLLRRLYVKGSLRNVNGGFEFDLKNTLGSGYAERVLPIMVDDEALPAAATKFVVDGAVLPFDSISAANPMTLGMNRTVTVGVDGRPLSPGKHKIAMGFLVTGMGELAFDVTDAIDAE
ncbi:MAG: hypothetical protein WD359_08945 [Dehalococcoidia bacterium]